MHELIKLELLKVLGRPVPYHGHVQRLDQFEVLLADNDDFFGKQLHQLLLQHLLEALRLGRGGRHDGKKQVGLGPPQLHRRYVGWEDDGRQVTQHVLLVPLEQLYCLFHADDASVDNVGPPIVFQR